MTDKININDEEDEWFDSDSEPDYNKNIRINYGPGGKDGIDGYFDRDNEWYEYGGRKLDKKLVINWQYTKK